MDTNYDGRQNVLFGMEQTVNDCSNTNVGGTSNFINTTRDSTIFGKTNVINVIRTSILGEVIQFKIQPKIRLFLVD